MGCFTSQVDSGNAGEEKIGIAGVIFICGLLSQQSIDEVSLSAADPRGKEGHTDHE